MVKLIIQIPCYNEEATLGLTLSELPKSMAGVDAVEWLIIDDGSLDRTVEVAQACGVHHIVKLPYNQGLARAFMAGIEASIRAGADIIVNTDADNQYCAADIPKLIQPIVFGEADMVVGARPIHAIKHFSPLKKQLQGFGSWVVRLASNTNIPDAPSGFRAFSREAALKFNVFNEYTYTLETIIQTGQRGMKVASVPIRTNDDLRPRAWSKVFRLMCSDRSSPSFAFL
jgi:glycosyltransferase involved in cell wall biosynthesis